MKEMVNKWLIPVRSRAEASIRSVWVSITNSHRRKMAAGFRESFIIQAINERGDAARLSGVTFQVSLCLKQ